VLEGNLNKSDVDDRGQVGDAGILRVGVDNGEEDVVDDALSQPIQLVGNLSDNFCCGKSLCSQK